MFGYKLNTEKDLLPTVFDDSWAPPVSTGESRSGVPDARESPGGANRWLVVDGCARAPSRACVDCRPDLARRFRACATDLRPLRLTTLIPTPARNLD